MISLNIRLSSEKSGKIWFIYDYFSAKLVDAAYFVKRKLLAGPARFRLTFKFSKSTWFDRSNGIVVAKPRTQIGRLRRLAD